MSASGSLAAEDTVDYRLFPVEGEVCDHDYLTQLAVKCTHHARCIVGDHLWHYEPFRLGVWHGKEGPYPPHVFGSTCFHGNIEDEWLIVHLLFALSRAQQQLVISVSDSDGDFLLIEAAHQLPKWLNPETSQNRVFIHKGKLHIIPKPRNPAELTLYPVATPTIREAIKLIWSGTSTEASEPVQLAVERRIAWIKDKRYQTNLFSFPGCLQTSLHRTHCYLPCPAAHVISHDPHLVAAAVHALCDRDPSDMQACRQMKHFSPAYHSSVMAEVTFTRYLYAQLLHQRFSVPRNSGFLMPLPPGNTQHKPYDLGMKLTCGLEILVSRVGGVSGEEGVRVDVTGDPRWNVFLSSLKEKQYFQGELEGSKLYNQLLATAKDYFLNSVENTPTDSHETRDPQLRAGRRIKHILQMVPFTEEGVRRKSETLPPPDDDSWLEITPEQLDEMMRKAAGYLPREKAPSDLDSMAFGMRSFVDKVSTHQGAEFPWQVGDVPGVNFDPDSFMESVQAMLEGRRGQGDESEDSDTSDGLSDISEAGDSGEGGEEEEMVDLMAQMDWELAGTEVGKSFQKMKLPEEQIEEGGKGEKEGEDGREEEGELQPVDVDFNLVQNLLESYDSQGGEAGPASNILHSMGVWIPEHGEEHSQEER